MLLGVNVAGCSGLLRPDRWRHSLRRPAPRFRCPDPPPHGRDNGPQDRGPRWSANARAWAPVIRRVQIGGRVSRRPGWGRRLGYRTPLGAAVVAGAAHVQHEAGGRCHCSR